MSVSIRETQRFKDSFHVMDLLTDIVAYLLWARGFGPDLRDRYAA